MSIITLIKDIRDINRFREILTVLFEEGFGYLVNNMGLGKYVPFHKRLAYKFTTMKEVSPPERLRRVLERLGPTFIKFGQVLSLRPDFVPIEYIRELEKMQDKVPSFHYAEVKKIVESELKHPIDKLFRSFDKTPIAAASLSQVHKAVLKDGTKVAVKVQRPNIRKIIDHDLDIMFHIAHLLERYFEELQRFKLPRVVEEFARWTHAELDFRVEGKNADRFRYNFKGNKKVHIPRVYHEYTAGKVLTLEFLDGVELNDFAQIKNKHINIKKIVPLGFDVLLTQVFIHGFFHADPHPGNIIIMKNNVMGLVDFGIVGHFNSKLKKKCVDLFAGIISQDAENIVKSFTSLGLNVEDVNLEDFKDELVQSIVQFQDVSISDIKTSAILEEMLSIALKYKVRMPVEFILFGKTISTLEGVALKYDPEFRLIKSSKLLLQKIIKQRYGAKNIARKVVSNLENYREAISNIPLYSLEIMNKIREGRIKIDIEDTDIKHLSLEMEHSSGNIAFGMIIAALIVASALIAEVKVVPIIYGLPMISWIGFILAMVLTFWLVHKTIFLRLWR